MISESTKYLYNRLPEVYRKADINGGNETLLRFLSALDDGGFRTLNLDIEKLYNIMSIEKAPQELIPVIGNMLGYKYVKEVDDRTQRKIVENLVELYKRKGTKSSINFIIREFTEFDTKLIQTEYRVFKTWSPKPKGIPMDEYVEPRTLGSHSAFHPNPSTCYLLSENGKYNGTNIIIYIVDDADENSLVALNNILREFMPVGCRFFIQGIRVNRHEDACVLRASDDEEYLRYVYREDAVLNGVDKVTHSKLKMKAVSEDCDLDVDDEDATTPQYKEDYTIVLDVLEDIKLSLDQRTKDALTLKMQDKSKASMMANARVEQTGLLTTFSETIVLRLFDEEVVPLSEVTDEEVLLMKLFDEETLPIIGTDSISEEV